MLYFTISLAVFLLTVTPTYIQAKVYHDAAEENKYCKTDILLVLDSSRSVGPALFERYIKPFLFNLVDRVKIGEDHEQLSIITFSSDDNTKLFEKIQFPGPGQPAQTKSKIEKIIYDLTFEDLNYKMKDRTYTGKALKLAYEEVFNKENPLSARVDAQDVVILFTDGQPNAMYYRDKMQQIQDTINYSKKLRDNGVRFISIAVERADENDPAFRKFTASLASEGDFFDARFDNLGSIIDNLVKKTLSCAIKPGYCKCTNSEATTYVEFGKKALVHWPPPTFTCGNETNSISNGFVQTPDIPNPSYFGAGSHQITYSYSYGDEKEFETACVVNINVEDCECTKVSVQAPLLKVGESTVEATWQIPKPSCGKENTLHGFDETKQLPYGTTIKEYVYPIGDSELKCSVTIDVKAVPCAGKDYNPTKQECCCGEVHDQKENHECCGTSFINIANSQCCPNDNVVKRRERCPGD